MLKKIRKTPILNSKFSFPRFGHANGTIVSFETTFSSFKTKLAEKNKKLFKPQDLADAAKDSGQICCSKKLIVKGKIFGSHFWILEKEKKPLEVEQKTRKFLRTRLTLTSFQNIIIHTLETIVTS